MKKIFLTFFFLVFASSLSADMGPKPSLDLTVYENGSLTQKNFIGVLFQCGLEEGKFGWHVNDSVEKCQGYGKAGIWSESDCLKETAPVKENGTYCAPWPFGWDECGNNCDWNYFAPKNFKVLLHDVSSGKNYRSDSAVSHALNAYYAMDLQSGKLTDQTPLQLESEGFAWAALAAAIIFAVLAIFIARTLGVIKWP